MKTFSKLAFALTLTLLFVFPINTISAATYVEGGVMYDDLSMTPDFPLPQGEKILSFDKIATEDAGFEIQIVKADGKIVDNCIGDAYTFKTKGKCYLNVPVDGKYHITFINLNPNNSTITMHYRMYDHR